MPIVIILVVVILLVLYFHGRQTSQSAVAPAVEAELPAIQSAAGQSFAYIAKGKLFICPDGRRLEQIHSPYIQEMADRLERRRQLHGWKANTSLGQSFTGMGKDLGGDQLDLQMVAAQFAQDRRLYYFLRDNNVGGLFCYDLENNTELRLLHRQNLFLENMAISHDGEQLLCSQQYANGTADIVLLDRDGGNLRRLTEGDTNDSAPCWITDEPGKILYQSSGLARSEQGFVVATGPAAIKMLDIAGGDLSTVLESHRVDYLQPKVDRRGNLYYIQRPYEAPRYDTISMLLDSLLFPFRLLRAVFHYLNFFSLMYSRKPLTSASGPEVKADLKDILIKGKRIDAERALRKEQRILGIPSLVPRSWQLIRRSRAGQESVLAANVASFDLTADGQVIYSNGYAVFRLGADGGSHVIVRDRLIAEVLAMTDTAAVPGVESAG